MLLYPLLTFHACIVSQCLCHWINVWVFHVLVDFFCWLLPIVGLGSLAGQPCKMPFYTLLHFPGLMQPHFVSIHGWSQACFFFSCWGLRRKFMGKLNPEHESQMPSFPSLDVRAMSTGANLCLLQNLWSMEMISVLFTIRSPPYGVCLHARYGKPRWQFPVTGRGIHDLSGFLLRKTFPVLGCIYIELRCNFLGEKICREKALFR